LEHDEQIEPFSRQVPA